MMKTKFDELVEFPSVFPFKVMGLADEELPNRVVAAVQKHAPGDYTTTVRPSSKGNYHSVSISVTVTSQAHIEALYTELAAIEGVRHVL
ncbi:DUF493 family protein YbeD [Corallincola platygyrae]|uniref:UPF0250 protein ACFSJ3_17870 n=1 Tax=Corallincola platygyrae TaxID=1193278 RepID=A0ABW4XSN0_9GAMM